MKSRYEAIPLYEKDTVLEFYNSYLSNIELGVFESMYIHPSEIVNRHMDSRSWETISEKDKYLDKYKESKIDLAIDILKRGNLFPFWVYREDGKLFITEGVHRLDSILLAMKNGIWKEEKVFVIVIDKKWDFGNTDFLSKMITLKMDCPIDVNIPIYLNGPWYQSLFKHHFLFYNNIQTLLKSTEDGPVKITIDTYDEFYNICKIYHKLLRHCIFKYEHSSGEQVPAGFPLL